MVLSLHITLNPLSLVRTPLVDVRTGLVTSDKRQSLYFGGIKKSVDGRGSSVDNLKDTVWDACFLC
jgi:hypothetical protein